MSMFFHFIDTNTSALIECAHVFVTFIKRKNENQTYEKGDDSL